MAPVRICPTCKTPNKPSELLCTRCFGDISWVTPVEQSPPKQAAKAAKPEPSVLILEFDTGKVEVKSGDVVGRNSVGKDVLQGYEKVSRAHAQFLLKDGKWYIKDAGSSNGTFVDGKRLGKDEVACLSVVSSIKLSASIEARVHVQ